MALKGAEKRNAFLDSLGKLRNWHAQGHTITRDEFEKLLDQAHDQLMLLSSTSLPESDVSRRRRQAAPLASDDRSARKNHTQIEELLYEVDRAVREWFPKDGHSKASHTTRSLDSGPEILKEEVFELVNRKNEEGTHTPIKCAVEAGLLSCVKTLIQHGADLRKKNAMNKGSKLNLRYVAESSSDTLMELAAKLGHFEITFELATECWAYTDPNTSLGAGRAVDLAFDKALNERRWRLAIKLMLACWLRNDTSRVEEAVHKTLVQAVSITQAINRHSRILEIQNADPEELEAIRLWARKAQLTAAGLIQKLSLRDVDHSLTHAWNSQLLKAAVDAECLDLLGRATVHGFFKRQWLGRLIDQLWIGYVRSKDKGITVPMVRHKRLMLAALLVPIVALNLLIMPIETALPAGIVRRFVRQRLYKLGFSDSLQLRWVHTYLLDVPVVKFLLWALSAISLRQAIVGSNSSATPASASDNDAVSD